MDLKFNLNQKPTTSSSTFVRHYELVQEMQRKLGPKSKASIYFRHIAYLLANSKPVANQLIKMIDKKLPEATITIDREEFDILPYVTSKIDSPGSITYATKEQLEECSDITELSRPVPITGISLARSSTVPIRDLLINIDMHDRDNQLVVAFRVITDLQFLEEAWNAYSAKLSMKITEDEGSILSSPDGSQLLDAIIHGTHDDGQRKILGIMILYNYNGTRDILLVGSSEVGGDSSRCGMTSQVQYYTNGMSMLNETAKENFVKDGLETIPSGKYGLVALPVYSNMELGYGFFRAVKSMETLYDKEMWFNRFLRVMLKADVRSQIMLSIWNAVELILLHPTISSTITETKEPFSLSPPTSTKINGKKQPLKYIRKINLDIKSILNERDADGSRKFFRKTDYWYVIGHYRHYKKSGKTIWIDGYWKGVLRTIKDTISAPVREREV